MPILSREDIPPDELKSIEAGELSDILSVDFTEEEIAAVNKGYMDKVFHSRNFRIFQKRKSNYEQGTWLAIYWPDNLDPIIGTGVKLGVIAKLIQSYIKEHGVRFQHIGQFRIDDGTVY
ncbi:MAG TPA: hypothetical protein VJI46_03830 [Candidatus Nanoarchaeia archaeon]|nr:hypothetical protein [Candidatus Nanoarchaeia archaeon]